MSLRLKYVCNDYKDLVGCLCKIAGTEEKMPRRVLVQWKRFRAPIDDLDKAVGTVSEALDLDYKNGGDDICRRITLLFRQIEVICHRSKDLSDKQQEKLQDIIFQLEDILKKFLEIYRQLVAELKEHKIYPCEDNDIEQPPVGSAYMKLQSKYLYCQATGSDGGDGTAKGLHLRWTYRDQLAKEHLPKGELAVAGKYQTKIGHNRSDDYVHIYRIPYNNKTAPAVDFDHAPSRIINTLNRREWQYFVQGYSSQRVPIIIRFMDVNLYDQVSLDPEERTKDFLRSYTGLIEIGVKDSLMFAGEFYYQSSPVKFPVLTWPPIKKRYFPFPPDTPWKVKDLKPIRSGKGVMKLEAISAEHGDPGAALAIACRKKLICSNEKSRMERLVCENIKYFRIQLQNVVLERIRLEPYQDFINDSHQKIPLGKFSLTLDDGLAFKQLEDQPVFTIDKQWPQFNDGTTVRVENYQDKWREPKQGIKLAVEQYLSLSKTDLAATDMLPSDNAADSSQLPVSYLSILNFMAADFHIARMLGLGYIDVPQFVPERGFVYLAVYYGKNGLVYPGEKNKSDYFQLAYMTLPTGPKDDRLPLKPVMKQIEYGLNIPEQSADQLFDNQGYSKFYDVRFVNLGREKYDYEIPFQSFFASDKTFCICQHTQAILYGIEYRRQGEAQFRKPEITSLVNDSAATKYLAHDTDHSNGVLETVPVPDNTDSLFVHSETKEGIHCYAIYGINWFSRSSDISLPDCTNETKFPKKNTLNPPSNVATQYIQKEETLIFTSQEEQDMLAARKAAHPQGDNNFTRVTFEYHHVQNAAYQRGHKVNFHFREQMPLEIKGKIFAETDHNGDDFLSELTLGPYTSLETGNPLEPIIPAGKETNFTGGILSTESEQFLVKNVISATPYPKLIVERLIKREAITQTAVDEETGETITTYHNPGGSPIRPKVGDKFTLVENLSSEAQWTKLSKEIDIVHHSNYTEQEVQEGGDITTLNIGGITGKATVQESTAIGGGVNGLPGVYRISYQTETLADHPDADAVWYKGTARVPDASGKIKAMEVLRLETQNPLVIWIYDADHATDPIQTGNNIDVNYHPGYKVYLYPEPARNFDAAHIQPGAAHTKKTLIGLQSVNHLNVPEHRSPVSIPSVLLAQKIVVPVPPEVPVGPTFATRPDFYGKSTYTFDVRVNTSGGRQPFGFVFFRADDTAILRALYKPSTIEQIERDLKNLDPNDFAVNRFNDLVNVVFDNDPDHSGEFKEYDAYLLPVADKAGLLDGGESVAERRDKLKAAINKAFVPLTKNPPLYAFIKTGRTTESVPPKVKNSNGDLLGHADPAFNPFPMARKYTSGNDTFVRFTDYTLDGTSVNMFFYYAVEISNQLVMSNRSPVNGPIQLVNTYAPEAPAIKTVTPQTANPAQGKEAAIYFQIEPYLENEGVEKVNIYRALLPSAAQTVRTMTPTATSGLDQIADTFEDLAFPPFGEVIYYRLVALRKIKNEQNEDEWVPSKASDLMMTNIIDVLNPQAPVLGINVGSVDSNQNLKNVTLLWEPTCYNGTYHLFKMTKKRNWEKLKTLSGNTAMSYTLPHDLPKMDDEGNQVYHRFKVDVVNASGLMNLEGKEKGI